jgi:hypothetical protein
MIAVAGVAFALLVLALLGKGHGATNEQIVGRLASEKDPRVVAAAADVLEGRGMKLTAQALRARVGDLVSGASTGSNEGPDPHRPPTSVSAEAWTRFVGALQTAPLAARSPSGRLGLFATHLRRLEQLGYVRGIGRARDGALTAFWVPPLTEETFLSDPRLQYTALAASMADLSETILRRYGSAVGRAVDGRPATLSGLLAVAHRVGIPGLVSWLGSSVERAHQRIATAAFGRANGIF